MDSDSFKALHGKFVEFCHFCINKIIACPTARWKAGSLMRASKIPNGTICLGKKDRKKCGGRSRVSRPKWVGGWVIYCSQPNSYRIRCSHVTWCHLLKHEMLMRTTESTPGSPVSVHRKKDCKKVDVTVDGSEILHQLRLVVYPMVFPRFYTFAVVIAGILKHQRVCHLNLRDTECCCVQDIMVFWSPTFLAPRHTRCSRDPQSSYLNR